MDKSLLQRWRKSLWFWPFAAFAGYWFGKAILFLANAFDKNIVNPIWPLPQENVVWRIVIELSIVAFGCAIWKDKQEREKKRK